MKNILLLSVVVLTGCGLFGHHKLEVLPTKCEITPIVNPPFPSPVVLTAPEFYVVSPANRDAFDAQISDGVFYAITPEGYVIMAQNFQELSRYIKELQQIIIYYKRYGESINSTESNESDKKSISK